MKLNYRILFALTWLAAEMAGAATLRVTSTADSGRGTLRDALVNAADGDTIDASRVSGTIRLTSGELFVGKSVVIAGPGPTKLAVDGNLRRRVFHIGPGVVVELAGLTITNGLGPLAPYPYLLGGGIYNEHGVLTVSNCVVIGNRATFGGGIVNDGYSGSATLTIVSSVVTGNSAPIPAGGFSGGGILNLGQGGTATATVVNSAVTDNYAGFAGGGIFNGGGEILQGFGLPNNGTASVTVVKSTVGGNVAYDSGGGIYNAGWSGTAFVTLDHSTLTGNQAGNGFVGRGGGVYNAGYGGSASVAVTYCAVAGNRSVFGGGLYDGVAGGSVVLTLANSTISGNLAAAGGGVWTSVDTDIVPIRGPVSACLQILNSTLSANSAETIYDRNCTSGSTLRIGSTILAASASGSTFFLNCPFASDSVTSLGYNLSSDNAGGVLTNATDLINTDPMLGPLQDNGGPTFTHALLPGSPAIGEGKNFPGAPYDQRGLGFFRTFDDPSLPKPSGGDGTDIGAFEVQAVLTPAQAVQHLLDLVNAQAERPQPLLATLEAALASVSRSNPAAATNQLQAFQEQVRAQVMPSDQALATELFQAAEDVINALNTPQP